MVGDTLHDAEIALDLGLNCCIIPNGHHSLGKFSHLSCFNLSSISDIVLFLGNA